MTNSRNRELTKVHYVIACSHYEKPLTLCGWITHYCYIAHIFAHVIGITLCVKTFFQEDVQIKRFRILLTWVNPVPW